MKIKTSELTGAALDWAVAKCEADMKETVVWGRGAVHDLGYCREYGSGYRGFFVLRSVWDKWMRQCETHAWGSGVRIWSPSTDWAQGGPIIEREKLELRPGLYHAKLWACWGQTRHGERNIQQGKTGSTPLVAAMRCYVASEMGDEVEIPDELA